MIKGYFGYFWLVAVLRRTGKSGKCTSTVDMIWSLIACALTKTNLSKLKPLFFVSLKTT